MAASIYASVAVRQSLDAVVGGSGGTEKGEELIAGLDHDQIVEEEGKEIPREEVGKVSST